MHSENIRDDLGISPFKETCLYIHISTSKVIFIENILNVLPSRQFICLLEFWSLMGYIDTSLGFWGVFFAYAKKGKRSFRVFLGFSCLITLINRSTFRVSQEERACRIYPEIKQ